MKIIVSLLSGLIVKIEGGGNKIKIEVKGAVGQYKPKFDIICDPEASKLVLGVLKDKLRTNTLNTLYNKKISVSLD